MIKIPLTTTLGYDEVQELVRSWGAKVLVFSIFNTSDGSEGGKNWRIDTVDLKSDKPAFEGRVRFETDYWRITEGIEETPVLTNPTWKEVVLEIDKILQKGDGCGVFLEGFNLEQTTPDGIVVYDIIIGS